MRVHAFSGGWSNGNAFARIVGPSLVSWAALLVGVGCGDSDAGEPVPEIKACDVVEYDGATFSGFDCGDASPVRRTLTSEGS